MGINKACAGILLTGGRSSRMGYDKARIRISGVSLAKRNFNLLKNVSAFVVEAGPGISGSIHYVNDLDKNGPLGGIIAAWKYVKQFADIKGALLLACDYPKLNSQFIEFLITCGENMTVIPEKDGIPQWLCAKWSAEDLELAERSYARGFRRVADVFTLDRPNRLILSRQIWQEFINPDDLFDVDEPNDLMSCFDLDKPLPEMLHVKGGS